MIKRIKTNRAKISRKRKKLSNIVVTNKGWFRYLQRVQELAELTAFPPKGMKQHYMVRLQNFIKNASMVWDSTSQEDLPDKYYREIEAAYRDELNSYE